MYNFLPFTHSLTHSLRYSSKKIKKNGMYTSLLDNMTAIDRYEKRVCASEYTIS